MRRDATGCLAERLLSSQVTLLCCKVNSSTQELACQVFANNSPRGHKDVAMLAIINARDYSGTEDHLWDKRADEEVERHRDADADHEAAHDPLAGEECPAEAANGRVAVG
jgi:hypothetical protein